MQLQKDNRSTAKRILVKNLNLNLLQATAPPYDYSKITVPIYLIWGRDDWATTGEDIEKYLMKELRKEVVKAS